MHWTRETENNTLVTYWGVEYTLLFEFEYPYFFGGFSADKIRRLVGLVTNVICEERHAGVDAHTGKMYKEAEA